jgi:hypothetical protein
VVSIESQPLRVTGAEGRSKERLGEGGHRGVAELVDVESVVARGEAGDVAGDSGACESLGGRG